MEVFRICKEEYSKKLIASGAANRWNYDFEYVMYAGSSRSLSTLESIVHFKSVRPKSKFKVMVISIPDDENFLSQILIKNLPSDWRSLASYPRLKKIGSDWYTKKKSLILKIPSAVIVNEYNYIINTRHPDFKAKNIKVARVEDYFWDDRLLTRK